MEFCKGFTKISQFGEDVGLNPEVTSDHAEILLETPYGIISSWNISNSIYHHYFGLNPAFTFSKIHMFTQDEAWLKSKIDIQVTDIVERLTSGKVDIQIIIEGYVLLFRYLTSVLQPLGFEVFYDENPLNFSEGLPSDKINVVGIIVNKVKFKILDRVIYAEAYVESNDIKPEKQRSFNIPVVTLMTSDGGILIVGGVHIHGSNSRFPKSGLGLFADTLASLINIDKLKGIIFMGDFNTIPKNVGDVLKEKRKSDPDRFHFRILLTDYPTMVNPRNEVSYYDMAVVKGLPGAKLLPIESANKFTQALLQSVCQSRSHFLSKKEKE